MAKTGIRHIAEKSADIIDLVQNKKIKRFEISETNESNIRNPQKKSRKIGNTKSTKIAKGYIIRHAYLHRQAGSKKMHPSF
jgi:hypothetical protein